MNALLRTWALPAALAVGILAGCNEEKITVADAGASDSGPSPPVLGGKFGAAVAAAESANATPPKSDGSGPPETGIFAPGAADAAAAPGSPPKVELLSDGTEPRVTLALAPASEQRAVITAGIRLNQQPIVPGLDFNLAIKVDKPKDAKDDKPSKPAWFQVVAKVASVGVAGQALPKEISDALDKLKGSELRYRIGSDGAMADLTTSVSKDVDPGLEAGLRAVGEAMTMLTVPLPSRPVGVGAYWIVTDRAAPFGVDVVRYRVFRVQKLDKDKASLTMEIRQYAARDEIDLGAMAKGQKFKADHVDSQGKGTVEWESARLFVPGDEVGSVVAVQIGAPAQGGKPGQAKGFQLEIGARTREPAKDEKKK